MTKPLRFARFHIAKRILCLLGCVLLIGSTRLSTVNAFQTIDYRTSKTTVSVCWMAHGDLQSGNPPSPSFSSAVRDTLDRRSLFRQGASTLLATTTAAATITQHPLPAIAAAARVPLSEVLYRILRVKEATLQETRLLTTGTFKDQQRNNVKLAIKFMIDNYRLNDAFITAASYLDDTSTKVEAGQVGQTAVQNLYTILEYFDSSDVQNLKVTNLDATKQEIVVKGLLATRNNIDAFLTYFDANEVNRVVAFIEKENAQNIKEFDPNLGTLLNMPSSSQV